MGSKSIQRIGGKKGSIVLVYALSDDFGWNDEAALRLQVFRLFLVYSCGSQKLSDVSGCP